MISELTLLISFSPLSSYLPIGVLSAPPCQTITLKKLSLYLVALLQKLLYFIKTDASFILRFVLTLCLQAQLLTLRFELLLHRELLLIDHQYEVLGSIPKIYEPSSLVIITLLG